MKLTYSISPYFNSLVVLYDETFTLVIIGWKL